VIFVYVNVFVLYLRQIYAVMWVFFFDEIKIHPGIKHLIVT